MLKPNRAKDKQSRERSEATELRGGGGGRVPIKRFECKILNNEQWGYKKNQKKKKNADQSVILFAH
jgi:hypothetical protein